MGFLWKNRNSCQNHKICPISVWKWVLYDLNDLLGSYHLWISKKNQIFFLKDFSKDFSLSILLRASVRADFPLTFFFHFLISTSVSFGDMEKTTEVCYLNMGWRNRFYWSEWAEIWYFRKSLFLGTSQRFRYSPFWIASL